MNDGGGKFDYDVSVPSLSVLTGDFTHTHTPHTHTETLHQVLACVSVITHSKFLPVFSMD